MIEIDRIYNEDCMVGLGRIEDGSVDLVLTDIPYNEVNRSDNGLRSLDKGCADVGAFDVTELTRTLCAKTRGSIYMFCGINQVSPIREAMSSEGLSTRLLIWEKTNPSPMNGDKIWLSGIECIMYGKKKGATFNQFCKNGVFRTSVVHNAQHPTQKPLWLVHQFVLASANEGDLVLDPFMGSGTTAIAAIKSGCHFVGFELNPEYYELASRRIEHEFKWQQEKLL